MAVRMMLFIFIESEILNSCKFINEKVVFESPKILVKEGFITWIVRLCLKILQSNCRFKRNLNKRPAQQIGFSKNWTVKFG